MENNIYDLIIIGAGPAGLAASIYASRYKIGHLVIGKEPGGQAVEAHNIENWPGTVSISGFELTQKMREHAEKLGAKIVMDSVSNISRRENIFEITAHTAQYQAKNVILALGMEYKKLQIPGEEEFKGKGVSYCPTCDAAFFQDKVVAVAGGGNSAASAAQLLAEYASKVFIIYRGEKLKVDPTYLENFAKNEKIEIIYNTNIKEIKGENAVGKIFLDKEHEGKDDLAVQGVFIEIGSEPGVELVKQLDIETDEQGFIRVNVDQSTNVSGVYAAGDATTGSNKMRQVLTAAAEGAIAASSVYKKLQIQ
jgi:thioredoxin reductase (NADPH)